MTEQRPFFDDKEQKASFGYTDIDSHEKKGRVRGLFSDVAKRYDIMNDVMSGGCHRLWKQWFVDKIYVSSESVCLDVAGGTGDIAYQLWRKNAARVIVCDLTPSMMEEGRRRLWDKGVCDRISWVCGDAENLPFPDHSFDIYTISYGLRNVTNIKKALQEAYRVLKPGGHFYCLEFSHVKNTLLKSAYDFYSFQVIPELGGRIAGDKDAYRYLAESIRRFPKPEVLADWMKEAGFFYVDIDSMFGGITAVHQGYKAQ